MGRCGPRRDILLEVDSKTGRAVSEAACKQDCLSVTPTRSGPHVPSGRIDEKARLRYVSLCSHADKCKYVLRSKNDNDLHT